MAFEMKKNFPKLDWELHPTNEGGANVQNRLAMDCEGSEFLNVVSGYSGMDQIIWFITRKARESKIRLVFGHEPYSSADTRLPSPERLPQQLRDYWLNRGFSPSSNSSVFDAIQAIKSGRVRARIHKERFLHAKAAITDSAAIYGSSNFSKPGLIVSRELNGRHLSGTERYDMISEFFEGCWDRSEDYTNILLALLEELLRYSTWQEALARSCAALLEGDWAKQLIPDNMKDEFDKLWPHQRQGIAQALAVIENQGAVVVADPTGSGKTKIGGWLLRRAHQRMLSKGGEMATNLTPTMVCPSSVEKYWYRIFDELGILPQVLPIGILSGGRSRSSIERLKQIERTNLLAVDEIHNFYGKTTIRTKRLSDNWAESRIFLTATPINKDFKDLIKLMNLLGTEELDGDTFQELRGLDAEVKHPDKKRRERARKKANRLIQRFMVRRTRMDLQSLANERSEQYLLKSGRGANYPTYIPKEYELDSLSDNEIVGRISSNASKLLGIARITRLSQTKLEKELGITEEITLERILRSQPALSEYNVWKSLDSSYPALYEHLLGTESAEREFSIETGKERASQSVGVIKKLEKMEKPDWGFSEEFKESNLVPEWLLDQGKYREVLEQEIVLYRSILEDASELSDSRIVSKIDCILKSISKGEKVLAFDTSNISLLFLKEKLEAEGVETYSYIGSKGGTKKKKVEEAEKLFGLDSEDIPRVALLSDMMSEGINLQGSSTLVHLTIPSTIRLAEQRVGRVDRMDTKHNEIEIYYPERDAISSNMKSYLKERNNLVGDVIGSNIKLPGDDDFEFDDQPQSGDGVLTAEEMNESMFSERNGLFDAFHDVRHLIGDDGLISAEEYELMRASEAQVLSYVGYVNSKYPWCFFVIESNKDWAPQWVFLDYSKKDAIMTKGLTTDPPEICKILRDVIPDSENLKPSEYADKCVEDYLNHLRRYQFNLLPPRRQGLLRRMAKVIFKWSGKTERNSNLSLRLDDLRRSAMGASDQQRDMRKIASKWIEYCRNNKEVLELNKKTRGRKRKGKMEEALVSNPPTDFEEFLEQFENIECIPDIETRVIAMIAGIPNPRD